MTRADTELNLLFGLLALQNDLIDRDALVAAFQAWARDKGVTLAEYLVAHGILEADDRDAVEALVARFLHKHGGDAEKSLASIPACGSIREQFEAAGDLDLAATLGRIDAASLASEGVVDGERTASYAFGSATAKGARFLLLRPHAKGGIGQVGVALDTELNREVALKEIQPQLADDPGSRGRFLLEAEITGRLEHPGVVPVYGLGADASGHPYYAMRLIRGDSLKQAIDRFHSAADRPGGDRSRWVMALRELLNRFVAVCNAVSYAHSRGVIHRDIKPANVMLGPYGETLVVDWGLAKVVGRDDPAAWPEVTLRPSPASGVGSSDTQAGTVIGTPAYMSPEQAEGRLEAVGPASDVYSLGATLYCLLTGRPPIEADGAAAALIKAQRGDYPSPRAMNPRVPPGLEAIAVKAMAPRPGDRYGSARAMAQDVEHWLAGEPVASYREPTLARLARWGRRHRSLVAGTAVLMVSALVALSAGLVLLGQASARTEQQRQIAEANFAEAQRQRDLARNNFQLARRAVDENFIQVSENTLLNSPLPGLQPLRKQLLESALKYYQQFVRLGGDDPAMRAELAQAYFRVGRITEMIGTPADALASFQQARDLYRALLEIDPKNAPFRGELARVHRGIGRMLAVDHPTEAIASFHRAIELGEALVESHAELPEYRHDLAWGHNNLGTMLHRGGQPAAGRRSYERAIRTWETLIADHPRAEFRSSLGQAYSNLGWQLGLSGRLEEALEASRRAVVLSEGVVDQDRPDPGNRSRLSQALDNLGGVYHLAGQLAPGRETFQKALSVAEPLATANPAVVEYQEIVIAIHSDLGHLLLRAGQSAEARRSFEAALARAKGLPNIISTRFSYAYIYRGLGKLERAEGKFRAALKTLEEAVRIGETSPGEKPYSTYELACARALCSAVVVEAEPERTAAVLAAQRRFADQAMDALRQAVAGGWQNARWMKADPDLDPLRSRDDFKRLIDDLTKALAANK